MKSQKTASNQDPSSFEGQGKLYAPPSPAATSNEDDCKRPTISSYHEGVHGSGKGSKSEGSASDRPPHSGDASLKLAVEKAMERVKGSLPTEFFEQALHAVVSVFQDAGSSTKDAAQRITSRLAAVLPSSNRTDIEKIVEDVQREILDKSESVQPTSKL